jgi:transketolase
MSGCGASAPAKDVYKHFGITAEAVVAAAVSVLGRHDAAGNIKTARRS